MSFLLARGFAYPSLAIFIRFVIQMTMNIAGVAMNKKRISIAVVFLAFWFLVADAYWFSKARAVESCSIDAAFVELIARHDVASGRMFGLARDIATQYCGSAEGVGKPWYLSSGLSYAEIILLLPVANRIVWR